LQSIVDKMERSTKSRKMTKVKHTKTKRTVTKKRQTAKVLVSELVSNPRKILALPNSRITWGNYTIPELKRLMNSLEPGSGNVKTTHIGMVSRMMTLVKKSR
jgi:hypothetical protein